ncbi:MAG: ATP-binding protein [Desulfovibrionaceae bacterium]
MLFARKLFLTFLLFLGAALTLSLLTSVYIVTKLERQAARAGVEMTEKAFREQAQLRGQTVVSICSESLVNPLMLRDRQSMHDILVAAANQEDVIFAYAYEVNGRILAGNDEQASEEGLYLPDLLDMGNILHRQVIHDLGADTLYFVEPISVEGYVAGGVCIGLRLNGALLQGRYFTTRFQAITKDTTSTGILLFTTLTALLLLVAIPTALYLARRFSEPLADLAVRLRSGPGPQLTQGLPIQREDEFGELARSVLDLNTELEKTTVSLDFISSILDSMSDGILVVNPESKVRMVNAAATQMLGQSTSEILSQKIGELLGDSLPCSVNQPAWEDGGTCSEGEILLRHSSGEFHPVRVSISPLDGIPQSGFSVCLLTDISNHKQAERELQQAQQEAQRASRSKSSFLANMSHEIRTPLNGILGLAHLALNEENKPEQRQRLTLIQESGNTLLALLNDILDLSRIEAQRMELARMPFDPVEVAQSSLSLFRIQAEEKKLSLRLEILNSPPLLMGDPHRLRQVLANLISNAIKFTDQGEIVLHISSSSAQTDQGNIVLHIDVQDTGSGIPQNMLETIFDNFRQAHDSYMNRIQGSGLGLAISRQLTQLMNGSLKVQSREGKGSTFIFEAPFAPAQVKIPTDRPTERQQPYQLTRSLRILLAEDNRVNQIVTRGMLAKFGHEVDLVENGRQAVEAATEKQYDCILMDVQMPILDGLAATKQIRSGTSSATPTDVPIIAMTAHAMKGDRDKFLAAGMSDYISKPFDAAMLQATLAGLACCPK